MKKEDFDKLLLSVRQMKQIKKGAQKPAREIRISVPNAKQIRKKLHMSQSEFAGLIHVSVDTVQNWEQGRRMPEGPARALLRVVEKCPKQVLEALHEVQ
jgi:putative transcriptional regulator